MTEFVKLRDFVTYMLVLHYLHVLFEKMRYEETREGLASVQVNRLLFCSNYF